MFTWLDEPFASEAIDGLPDGHIKRKETNAQIDQLLGGLLCSHQPTCLSSLIVDSLRCCNRLFRLVLTDDMKNGPRVVPGFSTTSCKPSLSANSHLYAFVMWAA
uniref:Uncharacterized protein n=1 Tax=Zea mays TaxID=4577 RepID=B7ZZH4_MAIZE|nr:unknown [Zea mays]